MASQLHTGRHKWRLLNMRTKITNYLTFSTTGWLGILPLLMPVVLATGDLSMNMTNFNHSQVELTCNFDYYGDMKDVFFDVYKAQYSCLIRNSGWCNETLENNCNIYCSSDTLPEESKTLPFLVKLNGGCDEVILVRCLVRSAVTELDLDESTELTAQSDPPIITVNNGKPVKASPEPVPIICTVTNICHRTKLDISVEAPMQHVNTTHTKYGSRFNTTSSSEAIFDDAGNYTVVCKETGKEDIYSTNYMLVVEPSEKGIAICQTDHQKAAANDEPFNLLSIGLLAALAILVSSMVILGIICLFLWMRRQKKRKYKLLESPRTKTESETSNSQERTTADGKHLWRDEILDGVEKISMIDKKPGLQVVCGENAEPILVGLSAKDVLISAAEFGKGRIVVISHDGYTLDWFLQNEEEKEQKISSNILSWITHGKYDKNWTVVMLSEETLEEAQVDDTVLIWHKSYPEDAEMIEDVTKFVWHGGSVIVGVTPWGSMQVHSCEVYELSCYQFLKQFEIFLTDGAFYNHDEDEEVIVVKNNDAHLAHFGDFLRKCRTGEAKIYEMDPYIATEIESIPDDDCEALLKRHLCSADLMHLCKTPLPTRPLEATIDRASAFYMNLILKKIKMKAPGVKEFPGDFAFPPPLSSIKYKIEAHCSECHPVGAYLAPGATAVIHVEEGNPSEWKVQVGCHSDNLSDCKEFKRWPDIVVSKKLESQEQTYIHSPFGGSVYFVSPKGKSSLSVRLKGIVESPLFSLGDEKENWIKNRYKHGLWADFVGKFIKITVPSESIREMDNPAEIMEFWDEVVIAHHDLKGVSPLKKPKEWFVPDIQPRVGYMHSGYPIVTHLDAADPTQGKFLLRKPTEFVDDYWGYFHELGHNMQDSLWTFVGTEEVTCNIFSLHAMEKLFGIKAWENPWLEKHKDVMKQYLDKNDFEVWMENPGIALGIYAQLAREFGFETYKEVFRHYNEENPNLTTDVEKIDHWVLTFSKAAKTNLALAFMTWGIPVSRWVKKDLVGLKVRYLEDEVIGTFHYYPDEQS